MKVKLIFDLPEDESEMLIAVHSMDMVGSLRDFYERLRTMKKYGNSFESADAAVECIYTDYCEAMQDYL